MASTRPGAEPWQTWELELELELEPGVEQQALGKWSEGALWRRLANCDQQTFYSKNVWWYI